MATHSSILAWEIPWTEEPGRLQSIGSQRVGHNLVTKQQQIYMIHYHKTEYIVQKHYDEMLIDIMVVLLLYSYALSLVPNMPRKLSYRIWSILAPCMYF